MPGRMRCLQVEEWGGEPVEAETAVPETGPNDVLVEVEATAVGRTVANVIDGNLGDDPADLPRIPGHELVGTVAEAGVGVEHVEVGDRVTAYFHLVCGHCRYCRAGHDSLCEDHAGWVSVDTDGGFAEYARLPGGNAIALPPGLDPVEATAVPDAVATPYHVANTSGGVEPGDDVMVIGAGGGVGIHMVQMARYFGGEVTAVDVDDEKLAECERVGATHVVNAAEEPLSAADPAEFDVVVDFVGDTDQLEGAVGLLGPHGRLVNLTTFPGRSIDLAPRTTVLNEIEVVGSRYCAKYELRRAAELVASGEIEPVVSEVVGFDGVADLLDRIVDDEVLGRGAMRPE